MNRHFERNAMKPISALVRLSRTNRGKSLETIVATSQKDVIRVDKMTAGLVYGKAGKPIAVRGAVDFVGQVVATGRAIRFDAKQSSQRRGLPVDKIAPHQLDGLERHGRANAITGILAECTHDAVRAYFWIPAAVVMRCRRNQVAKIEWDAAGVTPLGSSLYLIQFQKIPAVAMELDIAADLADIRRRKVVEQNRHADDPDQIPLFAIGG